MHTVYIKWTQVYSREAGRWDELSPMDVMQMIGRAGLQPYVRGGVCVVIKTRPELLFVKSLLSAQLPIESHLAARLVISNLKVISASGTNDGGAAMNAET